MPQIQGHQDVLASCDGCFFNKGGEGVHEDDDGEVFIGRILTGNNEHLSKESLSTGEAFGGYRSYICLYITVDR